VNEIGSDNFQAEVVNANTPVLVDFYAPWCGPCKMIAPMLDSIAGEFDGRVKVVKLNVDDASQLATQYGITSVPTLMLFKDGQVQDTMVGGASPGAIRGKLESAAGGSAA
jgi:thioredoxin 1